MPASSSTATAASSTRWERARPHSSTAQPWRAPSTPSRIAGAPPSQSQTSAAAEWLDHLQQALAPASQGSYQNYIDPTLTNWQQAYYGSNLPRLQQVKRKYDPDQVFHFAQSIPA